MACPRDASRSVARLSGILGRGAACFRGARRARFARGECGGGAALVGGRLRRGAGMDATAGGAGLQGRRLDITHRTALTASNSWVNSQTVSPTSLGYGRVKKADFVNF